MKALSSDFTTIYDYVGLHSYQLAVPPSPPQKKQMQTEHIKFYHIFTEHIEFYRMPPRAPPPQRRSQVSLAGGADIIPGGGIIKYTSIPIVTAKGRLKFFQGGLSHPQARSHGGGGEGGLSPPWKNLSPP